MNRQSFKDWIENERRQAELEGRILPPNQLVPFRAIFSLPALFLGAIGCITLFTLKWPYTLILLIVFGLIFKFEEWYGRPSASMVSIATVGVAICVAVVGRAPVAICLAIATANSAVLYRARTAFEPDGLSAKLIAGFYRIALSVNFVVAALWGLSFFLSRIPLVFLLDCGDYLNKTKMWLKGVEAEASSFFALLVVLYVASLYFNFGKAVVERLWNWSKLAEKIVGQVTLVLATIAAFTFVAGSASGCIEDRIEKDRQEAIADYSNAIWKIQLLLREKIEFEIVEMEYNQSSSVAKDALTREDALLARKIPYQYFKAGVQHMDKEQLLGKNEYALDMLNDLEKYRQKDDSKHQDNADELPPSGFTLHQLEKLEEDANALSAVPEGPTPPWLKGIGPDVLGKIVELCISSDRIPFLQNLSDRVPMMGKLVDVAFDAIDDAVADKIGKAAREIVANRGRGDSKPISVAIEDEARLLSSQIKPPVPSTADWSNLMMMIARNEAQSNLADQEFMDDLKSAIEDEQRAERVDEFRLKRLKQPDMPVGEALQDVYSDHSTDPIIDMTSLDTLINLNKTFQLYEGEIGAIAYKNEKKDPRVLEILGSEEDHFIRIGRSQAEINTGGQSGFTTGDPIQDDPMKPKTPQ